MSTEVEVTAEIVPVTTPDTSPSGLLAAAVQNGADPAALATLFDLKLRYEEDEARKAYNMALMNFKQNPPKITKNKHVYYPTSKGSPVDFHHATLDHIVATVAPALAEHGLTFTWSTGSDESGKVRVTCVLRHSDGHCEETTLTAGSDNSGGKNSIQAVGSTTTYLQRYTLLASLGLSSVDDDDGKAGDQPELITENQALEIDAFITDHELNRDVFVAWLKQACKRDGYLVENIGDLHATKFDAVMKKLRESSKNAG